MTVRTVDGNRTLTAAPAAAWETTAVDFLRTNTVVVGSRRIGAAEMSRILDGTPATPEGRLARFREAVGNPRADYQDFTLFLDDVMTANRGATGRDFTLGAAEALRVGVIDETRTPAANYPTSGGVSIDDSATATAGSPLAALRTAVGRSGTAVEALFERGATSPAGSASAEFRAFVNSPAFARLDATHQRLAIEAASAFLGRESELSAVVGMLRARPSDAQLMRDLRALGGNATFAGLSDASGTLLLQQIAGLGGRGPQRDVLVRFATTPAFAGVSAEDQQRLIRLVGGTNPEVSTLARGTLNRWLSSDDFTQASTADQARMLSEFATTFPAGTDYPLETPDSAFESRRRPYTITGPTEATHTFEGGLSAAAQRYEVTIDGRAISVFIAPATSDRALTIDQIARALAALPASSRALVREVQMNPRPNTADAYWAEQYGWDAGQASFMAAGADGVVDIFPGAGESQGYIDGTLIHETGHTLSSRVFGAYNAAHPNAGWQRWATAATADGPAPSGYARESLEEDFSEALLLYHQVHGTSREAEVRAIFPHRFAIIEEMLAAPPTDR